MPLTRHVCSPHLFIPFIHEPAHVYAYREFVGVCRTSMHKLSFSIPIIIGGEGCVPEIIEQDKDFPILSNLSLNYILTSHVCQAQAGA